MESELAIPAVKFGSAEKYSKKPSGGRRRHKWERRQGK
jgi:hypothetical protein